MKPGYYFFLHSTHTTPFFHESFESLKGDLAVVLHVEEDEGGEVLTLLVEDNTAELTHLLTITAEEERITSGQRSDKFYLLRLLTEASEVSPLTLGKRMSEISSNWMV